VTLALHLAATDLRRHWPILSAPLALHVLRMLAVETAHLPYAAWPQAVALMSSVEGLALLVEVVATIVAISAVVHSDPLVGARAFWLTRPIPPRTLLAAKALALSPLVVVPLALNAVRLALYDAGAGSVIASSVQVALSYGGWIAAAWLIASATPSTRAFMLALVGILFAWAVGATAAFAWAPFMPQRAPMTVVIAPPLRSDAAAYAGSLVLLVAGAGVLMWQHAARRRSAAIVLAGLVWGLAWIARAAVPPSLLAVHDAEPPAWFAGLGAGDITLHNDRLIADARGGERSRRLTALTGRFDVAGLPRGFSALVIPRTSRVSVDGRVIEGRGNPLIDRLPGHAVRLVMPEGDLLRGFSVDPGVDAPWRWRNAQLQLAPTETVAPFVGREVRLDAEIEVRLTQHRLFAELPLEAGAAVRHRGALYQIALVRRYGNYLDLRVRHARFPTFRRPIAPAIDLAIHEPHAWIPANSWSRALGTWFPEISLRLAAPLSEWSAPWAGAWQSMQEIRLIPPPGHDVDAWRRSVRLALIESLYAGRIVRQWSDPRVRVERTPGR
jgi:hypothetical protein